MRCVEHQRLRYSRNTPKKYDNSYRKIQLTYKDNSLLTWIWDFFKPFAGSFIGILMVSS